jgi:hypothetical protein
MLDLVLLLMSAQQAGEVQPAEVKPLPMPSDAVALFDGSSLEAWTTKQPGKPGCRIQKREMVCRTGAGDIVTKEQFGDMQLHLEFLLPEMPKQKGQLKGNSGLYIQGRYEVQILDSWRNPTYTNGMASAVYGQHVPLVNPAQPLPAWQTYDLIFRAPKCTAGKVTQAGSLTMLFNGVLVHDHVPMQTATGGALNNDVCAAGPIMLQDHSGFKDAPDTELRFRNVWIRRLVS